RSVGASRFGDGEDLTRGQGQPPIFRSIALPRRTGREVVVGPPMPSGGGGEKPFREALSQVSAAIFSSRA
ncbi:MAG TPA: hypothetical protein VJS38_16040, partial [Phenylobacterium sp.]|uniref:hypothetical protein n=1 Tax=Phenylobacterium sp. TaxID=1871053 RepID=UPI002B4A9DD0